MGSCHEHIVKWRFFAELSGTGERNCFWNGVHHNIFYLTENTIASILYFTRHGKTLVAELPPLSVTQVAAITWLPQSL